MEEGGQRKQCGADWPEPDPRWREVSPFEKVGSGKLVEAIVSRVFELSAKTLGNRLGAPRDSGDNGGEVDCGDKGMDDAVKSFVNREVSKVLGQAGVTDLPIGEVDAAARIIEPWVTGMRMANSSSVRGFQVGMDARVLTVLKGSSVAGSEEAGAEG